MRNPPYSDQETDLLLDVVEAQLPICTIGWIAAAEVYNCQCQLRSIDIIRDDGSLNHKFCSVRYFSTPCFYDVD